MNRFDDTVRSERYFTATLLPLILFHDEFTGLQSFVELIESRVTSERDCNGAKQKKTDPEYDMSDPEIITEFHIARDLHHYGGSLARSEDQDTDKGIEKRDAPDLVIVLGREMIVVEAKFFVNSSSSGLQAQLLSQRRQVRHLFENRPSLRAWRQVALVPEMIMDLDCDAVITWDDIADLSRSVFGPGHYVTCRFENAMTRYPRSSGNQAVQNYESKLTLAAALERCRMEGNAISIGHTGGEADLSTRGVVYAQEKSWKWRHANTDGKIDPANWIPGKRFLALIESLGASVDSDRTRKSRTPNYDGQLGYDEMVAACREYGNIIQVGHIGGEVDLKMRGLAYARGKRWKWRDKRTNRGVIEPANWISGERFATLADRLR